MRDEVAGLLGEPQLPPDAAAIVQRRQMTMEILPATAPPLAMGQPAQAPPGDGTYPVAMGALVGAGKPKQVGPPDVWVTFELPPVPTNNGESFSPDPVEYAYHRVDRCDNVLVLAYSLAFAGGRPKFPRRREQTAYTVSVADQDHVKAYSCGIEFSFEGYALCVLLIEPAS